tara:strand:+ start:35 stop:472 length:438 start_codon:yes stop_codon:yes gene_type:complete
MSQIEVDKVIPQSGTSLQIGEASDTITIPANATFDASSATVSLPAGVGSLSWSTKTGNFNGAASNGYFVDTSSGAITATLPATPSVADIIRFIDVSGTFDTYNLTIDRNGKKIQGDASNMTVDVERAAFGLIFSGDTQGWVLLDV